MTIDEQLKERVRQIAAWDYDTLNDDHIAGGFEQLAADICTALDGYAAEVAALKARAEIRGHRLMALGGAMIMTRDIPASFIAAIKPTIEDGRDIIAAFDVFADAYDAEAAKQPGDPAP
jgi:hypothetical protein